MVRFFDGIIALQWDSIALQTALVYLLGGGVSHPHTSGILAAQRPRCGEKARKNARWNFVDLNVLEIPGNPEILDKNFRKSGNLCQICTKSRNPGQFFLGFPKSGKSRTLFWVVKCPSIKRLNGII